ncbi:MAG: hypothetical protein RR598_06290 [Anaerorhabdus sp.]
MKYKEWRFLKLTFNDGVQDCGVHPYIVLLDNLKNNCSEYLLIKCKTFNPIKHGQYISDGTDIIVKLKRTSLANLIEPFEHDNSLFSESSNGIVSDDDFNNLGISFYSCTHNNNNPIYKKHEADLINRLRENNLIQEN